MEYLVYFCDGSTAVFNDQGLAGLAQYCMYYPGAPECCITKVEEYTPTPPPSPPEQPPTVTYYTLTVSVSPEGAGGVLVSPYGEYAGPGKISYPAGTVVTMTAVFYLPAGQFDHWEGSVTGKANPTTITMDSNKSVKAVFVVGGVTYELTTSVSGNGSIYPSGGIFNSGEEIILAATPASGSVFVSWGGDIDGCTPISGMPNQLLVIMDRDRHITAQFEAAPAEPGFSQFAIASFGKV